MRYRYKKTLAAMNALVGQQKGLISRRNICSIAWNSPHSRSLLHTVLQHSGIAFSTGSSNTWYIISKPDQEIRSKGALLREHKAFAMQVSS